MDGRRSVLHLLKSQFTIS